MNNSVPLDNFSQASEKGLEALSESVRSEMREYCQKSLYFLNKAVIGFTDFNPHLHKELCNHVQDDSFNRKLILVPRNHFKSSAVTIGYPVFLLINDSEERVLLSNATATNSQHFLRRIKAIFERNVAFRWLFPELIPPDLRKVKWNETEMLINRKRDFPESSVEAIGLGGVVTSRHYTVHIKDDLIDEKTILSSENLEKIIEWHRYSESLLQSPVHSKEIVIGTRYHEGDIYGFIIENEPNYNVYQRSAIEKGEVIFPEKFTIESLEAIRRKQGSTIFQCNPAGAPILMSNGKMKNIENVNIGDEIVGFQISKGKGSYNKLIKSRVLNKKNRVSKVIKLLLSNGKTIRCTPDHQWYTGRNDETHSPYRTAKLDSTLIRVLDYEPENITTENILDYQYLAGIIDGEGAVSHGSMSISQSLEKNTAVFFKIKATLDRLQLPYTISGKNVLETDSFIIQGGRSEKIKIINFGDPAKADQIMKTIWNNPARITKGKDKVISIVEDGEETVYSLETTSGNYIVWGYASKNCQYMNEPYSPEDQVFKSFELFSDVKKNEWSFFLTTDFAASTKKKAKTDSDVMTVAGFDTAGKEWIVDVRKGKWNPEEIETILLDIWQKWHPINMRCEEVAFQEVHNFYLRKFFHREKITWACIPMKRASEAKASRILRLQPRFENKMIAFHMSLPDLVELKKEVIRYPKVLHDDFLDTLADQEENGQLFGYSPHEEDNPLDTKLKSIAHLDDSSRRYWERKIRAANVTPNWSEEMVC